MAFTPESHAKSLATQAANRERKAAGRPPLNTPKKAGRKRPASSARKPSPTITLTPPDVTASSAPQPDPGAPTNILDPGAPPRADLHRTLMVLFGPINYLLHKLGGFDLLEDEANLILIPAERIMVRKGLDAHGSLPPDLFDGIQIATGVLLYGVRLGPEIAARRASRGRGGSGGQGAAGNGRSPAGGNQTPSPGASGGMAGNPWAALTPESIFADVGHTVESNPRNGHLRDFGSDANRAVSPGSGSE